MTQHDAWKTTNRAQEQAEMGHEVFQRSQEYMDAYVNYCDVFDASDAYDTAFENWAVGDYDPEPEYEPSDEDFGDMSYYGLHADDEGDPTYTEYGD